jgi:hypothetical protein
MLIQIRRLGFPVLHVFLVLQKYETKRNSSSVMRNFVCFAKQYKQRNFVLFRFVTSKILFCFLKFHLVTFWFATFHLVLFRFAAFRNNFYLRDFSIKCSNFWSIAAEHW